MENRLNVEFPCGLKINSFFKSSSFFGVLHVDQDLSKTVCPLHGKDCSKSKRR